MAPASEAALAGAGPSPNDKPTLMAKVARRIVDRLDHQGMRGKRRDLAAMELIVGAMIALNSLDERPEGTAGVEALGLLVSIRGESELQREAAKAPPITYTEG